MRIFIGLLLLIQIYLFGCGIQDLVDGDYVTGVFCVGVNLIFGYMNLMTLKRDGLFDGQ